MKKVSFLGALLIAIHFSSFAQDANSLHQSAKTFMRQGDYNNAIVVLNNALKKDPRNLEIQKDLAFTYYLQKNYSNALETAKPLLERKDADEQCYQITGLIYKAIEERKECEKMYK